jgi:hypothetical protein
MPTREQTYSDAAYLFKNALYPSGLTIDTAWLGIYQVLLWYEPVNVAGYTSLPHIIDADKLRPSASRTARGVAPTRTTAWQRRAEAIEHHLANELGIAPTAVESAVDLLLKHPSYVGFQRQNSLGAGFIGLVTHVLRTFGNPAIEYRNEVDASVLFPGIRMMGRSEKPYIDILALKDGVPRTVISVKWSIRHDRISDITNECPVYKDAAQQHGWPLDFYAVTNEFDPARLHKALSDTCLNGLVHAHKENVITICGMNGRLGGMLDLKDLVALTYAW